MSAQSAAQGAACASEAPGDKVKPQGADSRQLRFCAHAHGSDDGGVSVEMKCVTNDDLPFKGAHNGSRSAHQLKQMDAMMMKEESNSLNPPTSKEVPRACRRPQERPAHPQKVYIMCK